MVDVRILAVEKVDAVSGVTYTVSGLLIAGSYFSVKDIALIVGMVLGASTFFVNWYYKYKETKNRKKE